jgi:hypothetical protein
MQATYRGDVLSRSWSESWELVTGNKAITFFIGLVAVFLGILLKRCVLRQEAMSALIDLLFGALALVFVWVLFFLVHVFYLTPKKIHEEQLELVAKAESERDHAKSQLLDHQRTREHIKDMSDLWAEGKRVLENLLNPDRDLNLVKAEAASDGYGREASDWYGKVVKYLKANGESDDANYFERCDDGADQIPDSFPSVLEKRNALCRGIRQRVRNLRVILDREVAKRP